jgi:hypothetical protein
MLRLPLPCNFNARKRGGSIARSLKPPWHNAPSSAARPFVKRSSWCCRWVSWAHFEMHGATAFAQDSGGFPRVVLHAAEQAASALFLAADRKKHEAAFAWHIELAQTFHPAWIPKRAGQAGAGREPSLVRERVQCEKASQRVPADGALVRREPLARFDGGDRLVHEFVQSRGGITAESPALSEPRLFPRCQAGVPCMDGDFTTFAVNPRAAWAMGNGCSGRSMAYITGAFLPPDPTIASASFASMYFKSAAFAPVGFVVSDGAPSRGRGRRASHRASRVLP